MDYDRDNLSFGAASSSSRYYRRRRRIYASTGSTSNVMMDREGLMEWAKDKPLSILQLDPADRAVLRIAGEFVFIKY